MSFSRWPKPHRARRLELAELGTVRGLECRGPRTSYTGASATSVDTNGPLCAPSENLEDWAGALALDTCLVGAGLVRCASSEDFQDRARLRILGFAVLCVPLDDFDNTNRGGFLDVGVAGRSFVCRPPAGDFQNRCKSGILGIGVVAANLDDADRTSEFTRGSIGSDAVVCMLSYVSRETPDHCTCVVRLTFGAGQWQCISPGYEEPHKEQQDGREVHDEGIDRSFVVDGNAWPLLVVLGGDA